MKVGPDAEDGCALLGHVIARMVGNATQAGEVALLPQLVEHLL